MKQNTKRLLGLLLIALIVIVQVAFLRNSGQSIPLQPADPKQTETAPTTQIPETTEPASLTDPSEAETAAPSISET